MLPKSHGHAWLMGGNGRRADRSGYWIEWLNPPGVSPRRNRRRYDTREEADAALALFEERRKGWLAGVGRRSWRSVVAEYVDSTADLGDDHRDSVLYCVETFGRESGVARIGDATPSTCERWLRGIPDIADYTRLKRWSELRRFFRWCCREKFIAENPIESVPKPRVLKRRKPVPRPREWVNLLRVISERRDLDLDDPQGWYLLILLAAVTGLRRETLAGLTLANLNLKSRRGAGLITVIESKSKQEEFRAVPSAVCKLIVRRINDLDGEVRLFGWKNWQKKAWSRIKDAAGFSHDFHSLRRSSGLSAAIARLRAEGARHLWHSSTQVYQAHYSDDEALALAALTFVRLPKLPLMPAFRLSAPSRGRTPERI